MLSLNFKKVFLIICIFFNMNIVLAESNNSCKSHVAMQDIQKVVSQILVKLEANQEKLKTDKKVVHEIINTYLVPKADFELMSQLVLKKYWARLNSDQKQRFAKEFQKLMIKTYGVAFEAYDGETVDFNCPIRSLKGANNRIEINSVIHHVKSPDNVVKFRAIEMNQTCNACNKTADACIQKGNSCSDIKANFDKISKKTENPNNKKQLDKLKSDLKTCAGEYKTCMNEVASCNFECDKCGQCEQLGKNGVYPDNLVCRKYELSKIAKTGKTVKKCEEYFNCKSCFSWQVYDLIIDNISIIDSYRQVFLEKFSKTKPQDYDKLINDINKKKA